jgi:hypothetical protein
MKTLIFSLLVLISPGAAFATPGTSTGAPFRNSTETQDGSNSLFDYLVKHQVREVRLTIDMAAVEANRRTKNEFDATFFDGHNTYRLDASVRGRFRRITCETPPLKLQFNKDALRSQGLSTHNDFKLVTLCVNSRAGAEFLKREQLAYELHALVMGQSFRTQLLRVTYVDSQTGAEDTQYAILIEDEDQMVERLGGEECDGCYNVPSEQFVPGSLAMAHLFQYMVGNTDYCMVMNHNIKLVRLADGQHVPVAYDFDFSGLVSASYARPNVNVGQTSVRERIWMGSGYSAAELAQAIATFNGKEAAVYDFIDSRPYLDTRAKRQVKSYLKEFYRDINKSNFPSR